MGKNELGPRVMSQKTNMFDHILFQKLNLKYIFLAKLRNCALFSQKFRSAILLLGTVECSYL